LLYYPLVNMFISAIYINLLNHTFADQYRSDVSFVIFVISDFFGQSLPLKDFIFNEIEFLGMEKYL